MEKLADALEDRSSRVKGDVVEEANQASSHVRRTLFAVHRQRLHRGWKALGQRTLAGDLVADAILRVIALGIETRSKAKGQVVWLDDDGLDENHSSIPG